MGRYYFLLLNFLASFVAQDTHAAEKYFHGHRFAASVICSGACSEDNYFGSDSVLRVSEGQEYSIVVHNPLPVRVAAAVTVDGLNSIDGKRSTPDEAQKWIIEPYSSVTISGWQTSDSKSRKFYFTRERDSYSRWKGRRDGRDYSPHLGVIGIAYFWNSADLKEALFPAQAFLDKRSAASNDLAASSRGEVGERSARGRDRAGTGMGRSQWNPITRVHFYYDTGMYSAHDALTIRYEFASNYPAPLPFEAPEREYRYPGNYAPEM